MNEWTLLDGGGRGFNFSRVENTTGIPSAINNFILQLEFNCDEDLGILEENRESLAAIILEPIPGSCPLLNVDYLKKLEKICKENGILIIYDEIITGFRVSQGGIAALFGLAPDIVTYGKVLGGGLPLGLVAMTDQVAEGTFLDKGKSALAGGTFSGNPLVAVAALRVLNLLKSENYSNINQDGDYIRSALNNYFLSNNMPLSMIGFGSISRLLYTKELVKNRTERDVAEFGIVDQSKIVRNIYSNGIYWAPSGLIFNSFCHNANDLEAFINAITDSVQFLMSP
jgi:glutamate-1-semialdehyde 2,1-aminomutase